MRIRLSMAERIKMLERFYIGHRHANRPKVKQSNPIIVHCNGGK